ncbi:MAG: hypothetical protein WCA95_09845 [Opitutaceae bacterium]
MILIACGLAALAAGHYNFERVFKAWLSPADPDNRTYTFDHQYPRRIHGLAPIQIWREASMEEPGRWHAAMTAKLNLTGGQAFVGDVLLATEDITNYLDARVKSGEIDYVIIFPDRKAKLKDLFPVIDQCRKSTVKGVLLNAPGRQPESPGWIE